MEWTQERKERLEALATGAAFGFLQDDITAAISEIDRLTVRVEAQAWTPERRADLESLIAEALERDFDLGRAVSIRSLAKGVADRLLLEPTVWDFAALTPPGEEPAHTPNSAENAENRIRGEYQRDGSSALAALQRAIDNARSSHVSEAGPLWDEVYRLADALDRSVAGVIPSRGNEVKK